MSAFWFHYNRPASAQQGHPIMTVHYKGECHLVRDVVCDVPVHTRERTKQPRLVMAGNGDVSISNNTAYIRPKKGR